MDNQRAHGGESGFGSRRRRFWLWAAVCWFGLLPVAAQERAVIQVAERAGVARSGEYVSVGVPLPRVWGLTSTASLRLTDATGTPLPAQFEVLARWGSHAGDASAPIRWVLVGWRESLAASATRDLYVDRNGPGPAPPAIIGLVQTPIAVTVNTGAAQFEIRLDDFNLLHQVQIGGSNLLQPLGGAAAVHYEPAGTLSIVPGGSPDLTPRVTTAVIERAGPLCAVVRVTGSIRDAGAQPVLDFTARMTFVAGRADVAVDFTVENNHPLLVNPDDGQPTNAHNLGAVNGVYVGSLALGVRLATTGDNLQVVTEGGASATAPAGAVGLFQDSSGTAHWNAYVGLAGHVDAGTPPFRAPLAAAQLNGDEAVDSQDLLLLAHGLAE